MSAREGVAPRPYRPGALALPLPERSRRRPTLSPAERIVTVLVSTDNVAEALGAVVAEEPDIVLVGGRPAVMHGRALLAECRLHAPGPLLAAV